MTTRAAATRHAAPAPRPAARRRARQPRLRRISRVLAWLLSAWLGGSGLAWAQVAPGALPAGAQVVTGSGQLVYSPNLLIVNQGSRQLGLDWRSFNIGSSATVEFRQPGANAIALNRVLGNNGTEIYGRLQANGQVFLTNPNGILFAPGAKVDVGGLVASTFDLSQQDFADGRYTFSAGDGRGTVANQGTLRASAGGYLALFGKDVTNAGQMSVDAGSVVLASGRAATVSISGSGLISAVVDPGRMAGSVSNAGSIAADGGVVTLSAHSARDIAASLVNNTGIVRANALVERGGEIWITGDHVATSGALSANAPAGGQGGRIMVLADLKRGGAQVAGTLDASAGSGGQGGFIETSGARVTVAAGTQVQAGARGGQSGTWLIDPTDFTIAPSGGDVTGNTVSGVLNNNTAVTILSTQGTTGTAGNVNVNDAVTWSTGATLTLNAQNNVNINAPVTSTGTGALSLEVGQAAVAAGNTGTWNIAAPVNLAAGTNRFRTKIGSNGTVQQYESVTTLARLQELDGNAAVLAANYVLGADIDATSTASGLGFNPIGNETTYSAAAAFSGRFDGLGHTITGLSVNRPAVNHTGLFAATSNAVIANLTLAGGSMNGSQYVGGIVGRAEGTTTLSNVRSGTNVSVVDDSSSGVTVGGIAGYLAGATSGGVTGGISNGSATGTVAAETNTTVANAGGAVGWQAGGFLTDVSASGTVAATPRVATASTGAFYSGGLVGQFIGTSITRGAATGDVSGRSNVGGLAGSASASVGITASRAEGSVSGTGDVGGLVGQALGAGTLADSIALGAVSATGTPGNAGGLVGLYQMTGALTRGEANGNVSGGDVTGGLVGYFDSTAALANGISRGATVTGTTWTGGLVGYSRGTSIADSSAVANVTGTSGGGSGGLAGRTAGSIARSTASGNVTAGPGSDVGGLVGIAQGTGTLTDLSASGTVASSGTGGSAGGLFGTATAGTLQRGTASGAVSGGNYTGGLVGQFSPTSGSLQNSSATGNVSGANTMGGLVGYATGTGSMSAVSATGTVTSTSTSGSVGGLVGEFAQGGGLAGGDATGNVSGGRNAGGLVGYYNSSGTLSASTARNATVSGGTVAGGLVGSGQGGSITGSTAVANVTSGSVAGGLAGQAAGSITSSSASGNVTAATNVGGLVGEATGTATYTDVTATGSTTATTANGYAGGLLGYASPTGGVLRGTATGAVSGGRYTGGLIGYYTSNGNLANVRAEGRVSGASDAGGLVGYAGGTGGMTDAVALGNVTASTNNGSVGGLVGYFGLTNGVLRGDAGGSVNGGAFAGGMFGQYASPAPITATTGPARAATVAGFTWVGGYVGYMGSSAAISGISSAANVTSGNIAGGLAGRTIGPVTASSASGVVVGGVGGYAGGLVGTAGGTGAFTDVSASGAVSAAGNSYIGGLVGELSATGGLLRATASGSVTGGTRAGGLVGNYVSNGDVRNARATGDVTGLSNAGGLLGVASSTGGLYDSSATGAVSASDGSGSVGGLVGSMSMTGGAARVQSDGNVTGGYYTGGLLGYNSSGPLVDTLTRATAISGGRGYAGGLVGYNEAGSITNGVASATVTGSGGGTAGGLVGRTAGTITASRASGNVVGTANIGGLVGEAYGTLTDVSATGNVTGGTNGYLGGLAGYIGTGGVLRGTASGSVTGGSLGGGLVGYITSGASANIQDSAATGAVTSRDFAGGLVGQFYFSGSITNSTASGAVKGVSYTGGLVGYWVGSGSITDSRATGNVVGVEYVGGLVGQGNSNASISNSSATGNVSAVSYAGGLAGGLFSTDVTRGVASGNVQAISDGTAFAGGLIGNYSNGRTGGRIDNSRASGTVFVDAISSRSGGLVGQNDAGAIINSTASGRVTATDSRNTNSSDHYNGGLVGLYSGTGISGGSAASGNVVGLYRTGGLVGYYNGTGPLSNVSATGTATGTQIVGGLVGQMVTGGVVNGSATGDVTATSLSGIAGGLVGDASMSGATPTITGSTASGNVRGGTTVGGLVGSWSTFSNTGGITASSASGNVTGTGVAGGLVGLYNTGSSSAETGIRSAFASGNVQGQTQVGGLVGQYQGYGGIQDSGASGDVLAAGGGNVTRYLGGLVGLYFNFSATGGQITRSYASGNVGLGSNVTPATSTALYAGGLAGYVTANSGTAVSVTDAYATGSVVLATTAGALRGGGLVGFTTSGLARTYATGAVNVTGGTSRLAGGLVGERSSTAVTATSSYWATDTTGLSTSALGSGRTSTELTSAATFAGWDLSLTGGSNRVWRLYEGNAAPLLRGLLTPATVTLADMSKVYDGTTSLGGASVTSSVPLAHPERIYARGINADAGTYALGAAQVYSSQTGYDLTVTGSSQLTIDRRALTLAGLVADKVYDATTAATVAAAPTFGNLVAGEDLRFVTGAGFDVQFADKNAGTGKTVNIAGSYNVNDGVRGKASNYVLPTAASTTATITRATLTGGSFSGTSRVYDGSTTVAVTATAAALTGVLGSDSVAVDLSSVSTGQLADKNVGTSKTVTVQGVALTGADAGNYTLAGVDGVRVDITPRTAVVNGLVANNRQYDRSTSVSISTTGVFLSNVVAQDQLVARTSGIGGTIADKNVARDANGQVIAQPVTITGVGLRGQDAGNYVAQAAPVSVTITPRPLTITANPTTGTDRIYDGTPNAVVQLPQRWLSGDNIVVGTTSIAFADKNVAYGTNGLPTLKTITVSGITISGTDAGNYALQGTTATTSGTISPRSLPVSGVVATNRVYDGTRDVTVDVTSATVDTTARVPNDDVGVTIPSSGTVTGQMVDKTAGTNKPVTVPGLTLTGADAPNYTLNSASGGVTVSIARKDVRTTYTAADRVYDGTPYAIARASSPDLIATDTVSFYTNNNPFYTGNVFFTDAVPKNVGTSKPVRISFEQLQGTDAPNYNLLNAGQGTATASVTPKPVTLAFNGDTKVYDGLTAATVTLNRGASGVVGSDALTTTQNAVFTGIRAKDVAYNSNNQVIAKPIDVSNIVLSGADAFNYTVGNTTATASGRVTPKPVTLSGISAVDRPYDGTTTVQVTAGTVTSSGFVTNDNVAVVLPPTGLSTGTVTDRNVGTAKPVTVAGLSLGGTDAGNYSIDIVGSGITVNIGRKLITPAYTGVARVYDGNVTAQVTASQAEIFSGDNVTFTQQAIYTGSDAKNVGTAKPVSVSNIALGGSQQGNYQLASTTAATTADITPKPVTATYVGQARVYNGLGDRSVNVAGSSQQLLSDDVVSFTQTARLDGDGAAGTAKPVTVSNIALAGPDARNYSVANPTATTTATITQRPLAVSGASVTDRVYDGTTAVAVNVTNATVNVQSVIAGDEVVITLPSNGQTTGTMLDRFVGAAKPVVIGGLAIGGASAANYTLVGATGLSVNITPRPLLATWTGVDKIYNGNTVAQVTGGSLDIYAIDAGQVVFGATGAFTGAGARNVGTGKDVAVSGGVLGGALRDNYQLTNPTGSTRASITPRQVTASYASGLSKVYDGTTAAPASGSLGNVVSGDSVGLAQNAAFTGTGARNVGTGKAISITGATLVGSDAGNYLLATATYGTTGGITARPITVAGLDNVVATDRVYDGTRLVTVTVPANVTLVPSSSDIVAGDDVVIAVPSSGVTSGRTADKNAGTGKVVSVDGLTLGGADGGNYAIAGTAGVTVNIRAKALTASYSGLNRVYDGTTAASVFGTSTDIIAGDTVNIAGSGVFTGTGAKNVGTGKSIRIDSAALSGTDRLNYLLTNTTGSATADVTPLLLTASYAGVDKVYDGSDAATVRTTTGFIAGDAVTLAQTARYTAGRSAGTNKTVAVSDIALEGLDKDNYALRNTTATTQATITPKSLRIEGLTGVTAANRVYDGTRLVDVTVTSSGTLTPNPADIVANDIVTVNAPPTGQTTGTVPDKNAGIAKPVTVTGLTLGGADAGNYSVTATSGITVNITPKGLTAVYTGRDKTYDGSAAATVIGTSADILGGDTVAISGGGSFAGPGGKNVGNGKTINVSNGRLAGADATNYSLQNSTGTATASIAPKQVLAQYFGESRVYDGTVAAPVRGEVAGAIGGDDLSLAAMAVFTGADAKNAGTGKAVAVSGIQLLGSDAGNYALGNSLAVTTATVTPKPLRIDGLTGVSAVDRVYDGTRTVVVNVTSSGTITPNVDDLVPGDVVTIAAPAAGTTTGTVESKTVGTNRPVDVNGLTLGGADARNYSVAATSGVTVNITPKPLTALYSGVTRVYDGTTAVGVSGSSIDIVPGDLVAVTGNGLFVGAGAKNAGTGKTIAVTAGRLGSVDGGNYTLINPEGTTTGSITARTVNALYTGLSKVYDGTTAAPVTGTASGFIAGDDVGLAQTATFTGSGGRNVGNAKPVLVSGINLTGADAINYSLASDTVGATGSITPRPLRISGLTGVTATDRIYDGTTAVAVTVQSIGPVSTNSSDIVPGDDVTVALPTSNVTSGTVPDKNAGTSKPVTVAGFTLSGADAGNYQVAAAEGVTVNITPKPLTATYAGRSRVYDGTASAEVGGTSADIIGGDTVRIDATGVFVGAGARNVGTAKEIAVTQGALAGADARNYSLLNTSGTARADITPRLLTASYTGGLRVYDGTVLAPVAGSATGAIAGDTVGLAQTAVFTGADAKNAGTGKAVAISDIRLEGADAGNYALSGSTASTTATVTPRPLNVNGLQGLAAVARVYDGTRDVEVTGSLSGNGSVDVIAGDVVSVVLPTSAVTAGVLADKNVGADKPVSVLGLTLSGADAANYQITGIAGLTVTIAPRPVVLLGISARDRVYDGTTAVVINTALGSIDGKVAGDDLQLPTSGVTGTMADKHAGTGKAVAVTGLTLGGADAGNYVATNGSSLTVNIAQRSAQVLGLAARDRVYDGTLRVDVDTSQARLEGALAGDDVQLAAGDVAGTLADKQVGTNKLVQAGTPALAGNDAGDYVVGSAAALSVNISQRPVLLQGLAARDRVYDGTRFVAVDTSLAGLDGVLAGDELQLLATAARGAMQDKNVGGAKAVQIVDALLGGADAGNYRLVTGDGLRVNITPRAVTLQGLTARDRVYDGTRDVLVETALGSIQGSLAGDDLQLLASGATGTMADKHVGAAKAVAVSGLTLGGADAGNYVATTSGSLTVNIAQRTLLPTATAADKVYDGTTSASVTLGDDRIAGDALALASRETRFETKDAGSGRTVTALGLTMTGADAGNYLLAAGTATTTATITRAPATVTAGSLNKVYGETLSLTGTEFSTVGLVAGESIGVVSLSSTGTAARANAGSYVITAAGAGGGTFNAANYSLGYVQGQLGVAPRAISITASNVVRYADQANPASFAYGVGGLGLAEGDTLAAVTVTAPAASATAAGGSLYELLPSNAVFGATTLPANYIVSYGKGLLLVLPTPPLPGDTGGGGLAVRVDPVQLALAQDAQVRNGSLLAQPGDAAGAAPRRKEAPRYLPEPSLAELATLLAGDGTRINVPALQRLPLISLDPQLRQLLQGAAGRSNAAPTTNTTP